MKKGLLFIAFTTIIFSTMEIALKLVSGIFNPIQLTFTRFFVGGLFLIPFAIHELHKRHSSVTIRDFCYFAFLGFLGIFISMILYQLALLNTQASVVAVLFSCNPVFVILLAFLLLRETIHKNDLLALILEVIGTIIIINPFNVKLSVLGIILTIASTLIFALYGVFGKKKCTQYGGIVVTCFGFLFGSLEMLIFIAISHVPAIAAFLSSNGLEMFAAVPLLKGYSVSVIPAVFYICIINSGIGYACYFMAMEKTSAKTTSLVFFFKPILAPILALIILHDIISIHMLIGIVFILLGSLSSILPGLSVRKATNRSMDHPAGGINMT